MADDIQLHFIVLYVGDDDVLYVCQLINSCDYICMFDILPLLLMGIISYIPAHSRRLCSLSGGGGRREGCFNGWRYVG